MHFDTSDITDLTRAGHAEYNGYANTKAAFVTVRDGLLAARKVLDAYTDASLNPSGAVELKRLLEAIDRNDAIYR